MKRLEEEASQLLFKHKKTISVAESLSGGLLGHFLTNIPGSSEYFMAGITAYSNSAKSSLLGVSPDLIEKYGAVSAEVAEAMAEGVRKSAGTYIGLSTTGIAGPAGGTPQKPVGLVYTAIASENFITHRKFNFEGHRLMIKFLAAQEALRLLIDYLEGKV